MESNLGRYLFVFHNHRNSYLNFACFDKILGRTDVDKIFRGQILGVQKKSANAFPTTYNGSNNCIGDYNDSLCSYRLNSTYIIILPRRMCSQLHITADKRLRFAPPKLPSATSFIRKPLCELGFRPTVSSDGQRVYLRRQKEVKSYFNEVGTNNPYHQGRYHRLLQWKLESK